MLFVFQVRQSEVAVVTLFDKMESDGYATNPGPHLQWPWPIERVYKLDQRVHSLEEQDKLEQVTLPDQNIIMLLTYVGWRISDPAKFFPKFRERLHHRRREPICRASSARPNWRWRASTIFRISFPPDQSQMKFTQIENEILDKRPPKSRRRQLRHRNQIRPNQKHRTARHRLPDRLRPHEGGAQQAGQRHPGRRRGAVHQDQVRSRQRRPPNSWPRPMPRPRRFAARAQQAMVQSLQVMAQNPDFAKFLMDPGHDGGR